MINVLMIDDDSELTELLGELLELEDIKLSCKHDGKAGLEEALNNSYDVILLDVMMPQMNGFEVLKELRKNSDIPVLMLTAKGDELDKVLGLELGADDYLAKPFSDRELLARIKAIVRRTKIMNKAENTEKSNNNSLNVDDLTLISTSQEAYYLDQLLDLTSTEYLLLEQLLVNKGKIIEKSVLNEVVLGKKLMPFDRSIDMHVSNLRKKIPDRHDTKPRIKTIRGKGYLWIE